MLAQQRQIVAVECDVQRSDRHGAFRLLDELTDALGQRHAAALNADQQQVFHALVVLDDLMRNALDGTAHRRFVHNVSLFAELHGALSFSGKNNA